MIAQKTDPELGSLLKTLHEAIASGAAADLDEYARAVVRDAYKVRGVTPLGLG